MIVPSKFQLSPVPEGYVKRPRLDTKLQGVFKRPLTWIVAPPGAGKTTLVSGWKEQISVPVACIALEEADNHLLRFWLHVIAAIEHVSPGFDDGLTNRFIEQFMQQPGRALADLNRSCSLLPSPVALVLDDYHAIEIPEIHGMLSDWIKNMPANIHMVVISRTEAPLKLPKSKSYRIGWRDLAFTDGEAKRFYRNALNLQVSDRQLREWQEQTEGWVLGMRMLGATKLHEWQGDIGKGREPRATNNDAAGQGAVRERLMGDLLSKQSPETIRFLLHMSIPERFNEALCIELAGNAEAQSVLVSLEKENLFIQRLRDGTGIWYRYHPLIAQMLRDRLRRKDQALWQSLQWKTGRWLESSGYPMEAMEHYVRGSHYEEACRLLERLFNQFILKEAWTLRRFFAMIPEEMIQARPKLYLSCLFFAAGRQDPDLTMEQLNAIERRVASDNVELAAEMREYCMRVIVVMRAYVCIFKRDLKGLARYLCDYLDRGYPPNDEIFAYIDYEVHHCSRLRSFPGVTGHLRQAQICFEPIVDRWRSLRSYNTAYYAIGYAELLYEWNRLREAETYAELARSIGDELNKAALIVPAAIIQARLAFGRNEFQQAFQCLCEVRSRLSDEEIRYWTPILDACETKLHLLSPEGDPEAALRYLDAYSGIVAEDSGCNELVCALVYARALIAIGSYTEASSRLTRIQKIAAERGLLSEQLEAYILQAVMYEKQDKWSRAARAFGKAAHLSSADGHIGVYLEEGEPLRKIVNHYRELRQAYRVKERQVSIRYVNQILFAFEAQASAGTAVSVQGNNPLSAMEKQVLLGLSKSCTSKEIAANMGVSVGTVHTYIRRIFAKLQVNKRKEAVLKACRLGWLIIE
ncbi:LuxR C-terminal-related transcriptional regulator [Paenibacillus sp. J2TS4]|uniref:LuxR C-terminal-related transcriptional regulator n=1 Tax=Paenibacillus sp. J2TS4 TaxID=2807194 RepID=UPI001B1FC201|nr:LuxR C-terminal-related transcriptional regulator [Paenibacillus sp. J2TS4]GIP32773.1 hypothetical protein J2TS4_19830 [Paenibacillus sp. J2TS4]